MLVFLDRKGYSISHMGNSWLACYVLVVITIKTQGGANRCTGHKQLAARLGHKTVRLPVRINILTGKRFRQAFASREEGKDEAKFEAELR